MGEADLPVTEASPETVRVGSLGDLPVVDIADLLLLTLVLRGVGSVVLQPLGVEHVVRYECSGASTEIALLPAATADAVVARFAVLAGLPLATISSDLGRIKLRLSAPTEGPTELLLALRITPNGLGAELHVVGGPALAAANGGRTSELFQLGSAQIGSYRVLQEIGRGGMGIVYRAEHIALEKPVAIKVLHPEAANSPSLAAQFVVEARAACRARHPGIVDVTDFGALPDGRPYLVMELVEAPTLAAALTLGPIEPRRVVMLGRRIAEALSAAAHHGVVHRDLTPANVFVLPGDQVKLGDFGLARIVDADAPESGGAQATIMGTAVFMAPERGRGEPGDTRADIYSLGCVLFRMLVGRVPFTGRTLLEIIAEHHTASIPEMVGPSGPIPDVVQRIVSRAMAKRAEERYQSADEMIAELEHAERALSRSDWRRWLPQ